MIADAKAGKLDLIITKEVSRFARNTIDTLAYTRELKKMGIYVHFLLDNIQTDSSDGELRLTIMASMAQDESRKISERVKFGQGVSMKKGVVFGHSVLGYNLNGGILTINEEEAKLVKRIFTDYLIKGKGCCMIAKELQEEGIPTKRGAKWTHSRGYANIKKRKISDGILKQRKYIVTDYLEHTREKGTEDNFIIIENHHQGIVSKKMYYETQAEIERRRKLAKIDGSKYTNRYAFSRKTLLFIMW